MEEVQFNWEAQDLLSFLGLLKEEAQLLENRLKSEWPENFTDLMALLHELAGGDIRKLLYLFYLYGKIQGSDCAFKIKHGAGDIVEFLQMDRERADEIIEELSKIMEKGAKEGWSLAKMFEVTLPRYTDCKERVFVTYLVASIWFMDTSVTVLRFFFLPPGVGGAFG